MIVIYLLQFCWHEKNVFVVWVLVQSFKKRMSSLNLQQIEEYITAPTTLFSTLCYIHFETSKLWDGNYFYIIEYNRSSFAKYTLEEFKSICEDTKNRILGYVSFYSPGLVSTFIGSRKVEECEAVILYGIENKWLPAFYQKAHKSNEWKNGDERVLTCATWSDTHNLEIRFKIKKRVGISGMKMTSFSLVDVNVANKENDNDEQEKWV